MCGGVYIYIHLYPTCWFRRSTSCITLTGSKYHSPLKGTRTPQRMAVSKAKAGKI